MRRGARPRPASSTPGALDARRRACGSAAAEGVLRLLEVRPPGGRAMDAGAYLRGHEPPPRWRERGGDARPRRAAYEVLRRTFEDGAWTDRAFAAAAARYELERPRARPGAAPRLRRGAAARHQRPPDRACSPARRGGRIDAAGARRAAARASSSCSSPTTADHAAVDQAVELAKAGIRRAGAPHGAGAGRRRASSTRSCAAPRAERDELLGDARRLDPGRAPRSPTPIPSGWREMWWEELGATEARLLMAAMNEPRRDRLAGQHPARDAGRRSRPSCARPGSRSRGPGLAASCSTRPTGSSSRRPASRSAPGSRPASWCRSRAARRPSSRCSTRSRASGCSTSAPGPGSRRPRSPRGSATAARSSRSSSTRGAPAEVERALRARRRALRPGRGRRRGRGRPRRRATIGSSGSALLRPRDARLAARRALAQVARATSSGSPRSSGGCWSARRGRWRPAGRSSTRPARSRRARTRGSPARSRGYVVEVEPDDLGAEHRAAAPRAATRASCSCCPSATGRPASSSLASGGAADGRRAQRSAVPGAPAAASRGCARPSSRAATAASTACAATSSSRPARTAASTRRWSGCPPTRTCSASIAATRC